MHARNTNPMTVNFQPYSHDNLLASSDRPPVIISSNQLVGFAVSPNAQPNNTNNTAVSNAIGTLPTVKNNGASITYPSSTVTPVNDTSIPKCDPACRNAPFSRSTSHNAIATNAKDAAVSGDISPKDFTAPLTFIGTNHSCKSWPKTNQSLANTATLTTTIRITVINPKRLTPRCSGHCRCSSNALLSHTNSHADTGDIG